MRVLATRSTPRWLDWTLRAGLTFAVLGFAWALWPIQDADAAYRPELARSSYESGREAPRVFIDQAHTNAHTAGGRYRPLLLLLSADGYWVRGLSEPLTPESLAGCDVLVIANPFGWGGLVNQAAHLLRLERLIEIEAQPFASAEIVAVERWVSEGGSLLLVSDHPPAAKGGVALAAAFGVGMTAWWVEDPDQPDALTLSPSFIRFSRRAGTVGGHPITEGRGGAERIDAVLTFTGQALRAPPGAVPLLVLSASAREYPFRRSAEREGRSAAGLAQAVALEHGRGRVVVMGEAAALTAQIAKTPDRGLLRFGISRTDADNQQFTLNVMHWLSRLF